MSVSPIGQDTSAFGLAGLTGLTGLAGDAADPTSKAALEIETIDAFTGDLAGQAPSLDPSPLGLDGASGDPLLDPTANGGSADPLAALDPAGTIYGSDSLLSPITTSLFDTLA